MYQLFKVGCYRESTGDLGVRVGRGEMGVGGQKKKRGKALDLTSSGSELPCCVLCVTHEYIVW